MPEPGPAPRAEATGRRIGSGLAGLAKRYGLGADAVARLRRLLDLLVSDPLAPTSIRSPPAVLKDHLADSLVGLECEAVKAAASILDLGSGAGLPGLPLAIARPDASFALLESSSPKCRFLERAIAICGIPNAEVIHARAESPGAGRSRYDAVTVRAVASLPVVAEYAAPLLRVGGSLIAWRGRREAELEGALGSVLAELGLGEPVIRAVWPYEGVENRHLYVIPKVHETPSRFPRRPGMALKRPLGAETLGPSASSDRVQR